MKILIYILMILALAVIVFNITALDFNNLLMGESGIALIGILCAACVIVLLGILLTSRAIEKKAEGLVDFDVLIIGGGAAGMSCALVLGSAKEKSYSKNKRVGILLHQKTSHLQTAVINNALGLKPGTLGSQILQEGPVHLESQYPNIVQLKKEKVKEITALPTGFSIITNKNSYKTKKAVIAVGYSDLLTIKGLEHYVIPHQKSPAAKIRIQLKNKDHLVQQDLYVAGTLAGHRSQYAIACGSGAAVATDILTEWNNGEHTKVHDKLE